MLLCGDSTVPVQRVPPDDGGSTPTSPLQLRKHEWVVARCDLDTAYALVRDYHYAKGGSNTAVYLHGLYPKDWMWFNQCVGVAWWIPPTKSAAQAWAGDRWEGVLSLSRLVIAPDVPANACSFLLSKSVKMIDRVRWHTLVTYADEWRGHRGTIYRASGWQYCGLTNAEAVYTLRGAMTARKAGPKTRKHSEMIALGAEYHGRHAKHRYCLTDTQI